MNLAFVLLGVLSGAVVSAMAAEPVRITHGPILGRVGPHEMGLWARTSESGTFFVCYGRCADKLDHHSVVVDTRPENDNVGWVHIQGLRSNSEY